MSARPAQRLGVHGVGAYLPGEVRQNHAWSPDVVAGWRRADAWRSHLGAGGPGSDVAACIAEEVARDMAEPLARSHERRVLPAHEAPSTMAVRAARMALERSSVAARDIDFIIDASVVPDHLTVPNAPRVHRELGLGRACLAFDINASFNSFAVQMQLAHGLIGSGARRFGLLVQSSALSRLIPADASIAPWFGDGATAVLVGPASRDRGLLAQAHGTDGRFHDAVVAGVPGADSWYEPGPIQWQVRDPEALRAVLTGAAELGREVVLRALARSGHTTDQVDFYAAHQPSAWFRALTQRHIGLCAARSVDTFSWAGSLGAANIPLVFCTALARGALADGDLVVTYSGGHGITWSAMVLRWGV